MLPSLSGPIKNQPRSQKALGSTDVEIETPYQEIKKGPYTEKVCTSHSGVECKLGQWIYWIFVFWKFHFEAGLDT